MRWPERAPHPDATGKLNLSVLAVAFAIFGFSLVFQAHRWASTPAYHVLLLIFPAQVWGLLFLASAAAMGAAVWQFGRRWLVTVALMVAFTLTTGWALAFIARYLSNGSTTPETWVSWGVFDFLLLRVAASLDRPRPAAVQAGEIETFRHAIDLAVNGSPARVRDAVSVACAAYAQALYSVIPAGGMPGGDPAKLALDEARHALLRAEEAYARATGEPAHTRDTPGTP